MPIRAVVFDLYITLTDWEAERGRPQMMEELAAAIGADPVEFSQLMRATFTDRVAGHTGDARATFARLATTLGCELTPAALDGVVALRFEQTRQTLAPRAGVLDALHDLGREGYAIGVLTDCTAETPELWPSLPYAAVVDAVTFSCELIEKLGRMTQVPADPAAFKRRCMLSGRLDGSPRDYYPRGARRGRADRRWRLTS